LMDKLDASDGPPALVPNDLEACCLCLVAAAVNVVELDRKPSNLLDMANALNLVRWESESREHCLGRRNDQGARGASVRDSLRGSPLVEMHPYVANKRDPGTDISG